MSSHDAYLRTSLRKVKLFLPLACIQYYYVINYAFFVSLLFADSVACFAFLLLKIDSILVVNKCKLLLYHIVVTGMIQHCYHFYQLTTLLSFLSVDLHYSDNQIPIINLLLYINCNSFSVPVPRPSQEGHCECT